jgi:hypothetical protein
VSFRAFLQSADRANLDGEINLLCRRRLRHRGAPVPRFATVSEVTVVIARSQHATLASGGCWRA